jgi:UDP-N-acetylglucosamine:LPS N-acetylglucosamine transferase
MKIALVCSHGGHLTEMLFLMDAFKDHDIFFVTYNNFRTEDLGYHKYLLENIKTSPIKMIKAFNQFLRIFRKEKPEIVISTGSEIALPAFIVAKLFRK